MSIPDAPVKEIMKDMMEMCRGVQHPIRYVRSVWLEVLSLLTRRSRGLFLRYYLSQQARDSLPTGNNDGSVPGN